MANPLNVIQQFQQALGNGDFTAARQLLHDNLSFRGPIDTCQKPEPYLEALKKLQPIIQRIDILKMFADGNDVCVLCDSAVSCEKSCGGLSILHFSNVLSLGACGSRGDGRTSLKFFGALQ
jgi:hypothetical protein